MANSLQGITDLGQSIWLDYVHRKAIKNGEIDRFIREDGITGFTSNPSIFQKAIDGGDVYTDDIHDLSMLGRMPGEIYEEIAIEDIQDIADALREVYDRTEGADGYVSLEVNPHFAHDTDSTIAEAHRLWEAIKRPNAMIKIPGTKEGVPAIRQCLTDGINVNVTLLFGVDRYREVAEAHVEAMEARLRTGASVSTVASVASFFLSRIDVLVDSTLDDHADSEKAGQLRGRIAIASARQAYRVYKEIYDSDRFGQLAEYGARPQRLLWASTSTKDPSYSDVKYVEALIGPHTVNTLPPKTLEAYRDHGQPEARLETESEEADRALEELENLGIKLDEVTQQLEDEGVKKFVKPHDELLKTLKTQRRDALDRV